MKQSTPSRKIEHKEGVGFGLGVQYKTMIVNPDGSIAKENDFTSNLILDTGLDAPASNAWQRLIRYCAVGTGLTPTERDSGTTTVTISGTTATSSIAFFEAADAGRLLKLDTGEEYYITAYTSSTQVTIDTSAAHAATECSIWYVNETGHSTEVARTAAVTTDSGDNGQILTGGDTVQFQRTFLFPAEVGPVTYTEVGWSWGTTGTDLFGRDLISPGDSLIAGQQYKVVVRLNLALSPSSSTAIADTSGGTWNTAGNHVIHAVYYGFQLIQPDGDESVAEGALDVNNDSAIRTKCSLVAADWTLPAGPNIATSPGLLVVYAPTISDQPSTTMPAYASGNYYRDKIAEFEVNVGNTTARGVALHGGNGSSQYCPYQLKFTTPVDKENTHSLTLTFRLSWGRTLTNS